MNCKFMKFMRKHYMYNDLTKDHFGITVVGPEAEPVPYSRTCRSPAEHTLRRSKRLAVG